MFWKIIRMLKNFASELSAINSDKNSTNANINDFADGTGIQIVVSDDITLQNCLLYSITSTYGNIMVKINGKNYDIGSGEFEKMDAASAFTFPMYVSTLKCTGSINTITYKPRN